MVETVVNKELANEETLQVLFLVDTKEALDEAGFAALQEKDAANAPAEPVARVMVARFNEPKKCKA